MKRFLAYVVMLLLLAGMLASCGYSTAKPGQCMWCDGFGYASYKDASGNYRTKTCSHCHGTGRSN